MTVTPGKPSKPTRPGTTTTAQLEPIKESRPQHHQPPRALGGHRTQQPGNVLWCYTSSSGVTPHYVPNQPPRHTPRTDSTLTEASVPERQRQQGRSPITPRRSSDAALDLRPAPDRVGTVLLVLGREASGQEEPSPLSGEPPQDTQFGPATRWRLPATRGPERAWTPEGACLGGAHPILLGWAAAFGCGYDRGAHPPPTGRPPRRVRPGAPGGPSTGGRAGSAASGSRAWSAASGWCAEPRTWSWCDQSSDRAKGDCPRWYQKGLSPVQSC